MTSAIPVQVNSSESPYRCFGGWGDRSNRRKAKALVTPRFRPEHKRLLWGMD
jgi:hypothetical protein